MKGTPPHISAQHGAINVDLGLKQMPSVNDRPVEAVAVLYTP